MKNGLNNSVLNASRKLFDWLASFQVKAIIVDIKKVDNRLEVIFDHPMRGEFHTTIDVPHSRYIQMEGITFEVLLNSSKELPEIKCYDTGGILDPIEKKVIGGHYATSHFALLAACLYKVTKEIPYLKAVSSALGFARRISGNYIFQDWDNHWEFDNFAWAEVLFLLSDEPEFRDTKILKSMLNSSSRHLRPYSTNWKILGISFLERFTPKTIHGIIFGMVHKVYLKKQIQKAFLFDGCIEDIPQLSFSLQYHSFSAALLAKLVENKTPVLNLDKVLGAARYLSSFIVSNGDFNFLGRGQKQIFGYAPAIYLLLFAYKIVSGPENQLYLNQAAGIYEYLQKSQLDSGAFPLVLSPGADNVYAGWYSYNYLSVYNAMVGAWFGLLMTNFQETSDLHCIGELNGIDIPSEATFHNASKVLIYKSPDYYFCSSAGYPQYEADCGFVPQEIFIKGIGEIVSSPGGPGKGKYGKYRNAIMDLNFLSPLINRKDIIYGPSGVRAQEFNWDETKKHLRIIVEYLDKTIVERHIQFFDFGFSIDDRIEIMFRGATSLIGINIPLCKSTGAIISSTPQLINVAKNGHSLSINLFTDQATNSTLITSTGWTAAGEVEVQQMIWEKPEPGVYRVKQVWQIRKEISY